jgi:hypothetical protein
LGLFPKFWRIFFSTVISDNLMNLSWVRVKNRNYKASHYTLFSSFLLLPHS